jgi:hypothetical protein
MATFLHVIRLIRSITTFFLLPARTCTEAVSASARETQRPDVVRMVPEILGVSEHVAPHGREPHCPPVALFYYKPCGPTRPRRAGCPCRPNTTTHWRQWWRNTTLRACMCGAGTAGGSLCHPSVTVNQAMTNCTCAPIQNLTDLRERAHALGRMKMVLTDMRVLAC